MVSTDTTGSGDGGFELTRVASIATIGSALGGGALGSGSAVSGSGAASRSAADGVVGFGSAAAASAAGATAAAAALAADTLVGSTTGATAVLRRADAAWRAGVASCSSSDICVTASAVSFSSSCAVA